MTRAAGGFFRSAPKVSARDRLADLARVHVRAGLLDPETMHRDVASAVAADLSGEREPAATARTFLAEARAELLAEQAGWQHPTDHERLQDALADLEQQRVVVLQAVDDHWVADAELRRQAAAGAAIVGVVWFTAPDVWHAVDHGMLELNVWHADSANVAPGEPLLDLVVSTLADHDLAAHFDEGRVEVAARWQRPLAAPDRP